jgi:hypothetical protein
LPCHRHRHRHHPISKEKYASGRWKTVFVSVFVEYEYNDDPSDAIEDKDIASSSIYIDIKIGIDWVEKK